MTKHSSPNSLFQDNTYFHLRVKKEGIFISTLTRQQMKVSTSFLFRQTCNTDNIIIIYSTKSFLGKNNFCSINDSVEFFVNYCSGFATRCAQTTEMDVSISKCLSIIIEFFEIDFTLFLKKKFFER